MPSSVITLAGQKVKLEANAYSLILYEDEFKGRNFIADFENVLGLRGDIEASNHIRFTWALAKTANPNIEGFAEFARKYSLNDVFSIIKELSNLISQSLGVADNSKKEVAAAQ